MRIDHGFDPLSLGQEFVLVPMRDHEFLHVSGILFSDGRDLIQFVGNKAHRTNGAGRAAIDPERAVFLKHAVGAPRQEMELVGFGVEIDKEIVPVAGVAVPKTEQAFHSPKGVKRLLIYEFPYLLLQVVIIGL